MRNDPKRDSSLFGLLLDSRFEFMSNERIFERIHIETSGLTMQLPYWHSLPPHIQCETAFSHFNCYFRDMNLSNKRPRRS